MSDRDSCIVFCVFFVKYSKTDPDPVIVRYLAFLTSQGYVSHFPLLVFVICLGKLCLSSLITRKNQQWHRREDWNHCISCHLLKGLFQSPQKNTFPNPYHPSQLVALGTPDPARNGSGSLNTLWSWYSNNEYCVHHKILKA